MLTTILFDLDGTLLPMDQEEFTKVYLGLLAQKCAPYGYEPKQLVGAVWEGTKAMIGNDGAKTNEERFWDRFSELLGDDIRGLQAQLELFYSKEFHGAKSTTWENPTAVKLLRELKAAGYTLVLATNPQFPLRAIHSRLSWVGIPMELFDLITTYENSHYCKPNTEYYAEILAKLHTYPENCLMVGNDWEEDGCVRKLGMDFFLVTGCGELPQDADLDKVKHGSFDDLNYWLREKCRKRAI